MKRAQSLRVCCVLTFPHFLPFNQSSTKTRAETQCACREQLWKVCLPPSTSVSVLSHLGPLLGGWVNPPLSSSAAKALQASAILAVPWYSHASSCLLKGMLAEGTVVESWHRAAVEFSGWQWGEKAEHGAEPPAHCCLRSWKSLSSVDQTLHMKVHFHQLQLSLHLFSSPSPLALQMGAQPPSCAAAFPPPAPSLSSLAQLHSSLSLGALGVTAALP